MQQNTEVLTPPISLYAIFWHWPQGSWGQALLGGL